MWYLGLGSTYGNNYEALMWLYYEVIIWKTQFFSDKSAEAMKIEKWGLSIAKYFMLHTLLAMYLFRVIWWFGIVFVMPWGIPKNAFYLDKYIHKSIHL